MTQSYRYGDAATARPHPDADGSRVISFFIFNTGVHVHAYARDGEDAGAPATVERLDAALLACRDRCLFFEHAFSRTRPDSDIARAHAASPAPVKVAPQTARLVRLALGYCARSRGLFDITMGTVTSLWDFHEGIVPSRAAVAAALPHVGCEHIQVCDPGAEEPCRACDAAVPAGEGPAPAPAAAAPPTLAITDPETVLDLGGIAKGYIADDLGDLLEACGVTRFAINLGGNVLVRGGRPAAPHARPAVRAGAPWRIGIVNPRDPGHFRAIVDLADGSVVTSGVHERRFMRGGVSYHHILDPRTGFPAKTDVASATIVAARSLDCDGYSTTAFMLGAREAIDFVESLDGVEAVIVDEADQVFWTSGLDEVLSLVPTLI